VIFENEIFNKTLDSEEVFGRASSRRELEAVATYKETP
jgi:hypothetical protein